MLGVAALAALAASPGAGATTTSTPGAPGSPSAPSTPSAPPPPARPPAPKPAVTLNWVGDIALSARQGLPADGGRSLFAGVEPRLRRADLVLGNLEGTLGTGGSSKCAGASASCFAFQAPPSWAGVLRRAGLKLVNVANNHAFDYGAEGQRETLAALRGAGIAETGRPDQITIERVGSVRVAFVGFAPYPWASSLLDIASARRLVARARRRAAIVVVIIHAGAEGAGETHTPYGEEHDFGEDRGNARRFAHAVIDAGASVVLGSGPHVVRGLDCYRHGLIAYSLGNFVGYNTLATGGVLSLSGILQLRFDIRGRLLGGRWSSVRIDAPGVPRLDPTNASASLVARLSRQDFGAEACRIGRAGAIRVR